MNSELLVIEFLAKYNLSTERFDKASMRQGRRQTLKSILVMSYIYIVKSKIQKKTNGLMKKWIKPFLAS